MQDLLCPQRIDGAPFVVNVFKQYQVTDPAGLTIHVPCPVNEFAHDHLELVFQLLVHIPPIKRVLQHCGVHIHTNNYETAYLGIDKQQMCPKA